MTTSNKYPWLTIARPEFASGRVFFCVHGETGASAFRLGDGTRAVGDDHRMALAPACRCTDSRRQVAVGHGEPPLFVQSPCPLGDRFGFRFRQLHDVTK
jgi:hypothetical protein